MVNLINELKISDNPTIDERKRFVSQISRYTTTKEEHAEIVKKEVRIIWGDYFKPEHVQQHPELHELVFKIMKLASKARQEVNMEASQELLESLHKFAEIFWKTKGMSTTKVKAPSPLGGEIVVQK
jgi:nickel superoxide dismutase